MAVAAVVMLEVDHAVVEWLDFSVVAGAVVCVGRVCENIVEIFGFDLLLLGSIAICCFN